MSFDNLADDFKQRESRYFEELSEFLRFKSISADSEYKTEVLACVNWLKTHVSKLGFEAEIRETSGYPALVASRLINPNLPTILFYGHYDVQPPDPLDQWESDPFEPTIRNQRIYARGAQDDKGQVFFVLKAIDYLIEKSLLNVNLKLCIEGEEEIGSPGLPTALPKWKDDLKADLLLICDTNKTDTGNPCMVAGLRGIAGYEFKVKTAERMLHSGHYGGAVANAASVAANLISTFHDAEGRITIEGLYEDVVSISDKTTELILAASESDKEAIKAIGAKKTWGEPEYPRAVRTRLRPSLDINGITAGYQGEGSKTVIPNTASFKLTIRLVPNQTPKKITELLLAHIEKHCPDTAEVELLNEKAASPALGIDPEQAELKHVLNLLAKISDKEPMLDWMGGSIPIISDLAKSSGAVPLLVGFGTDQGRIHEPNESFGIQDFWEGFRFATHLLSDPLPK
ncbi:MAG: M20/M25/M40 family metallo-hydrolase [Bdellovibrionota bacterium]